MKPLALLFAAGRVIIAPSAQDLSSALDVHLHCHHKWKLQIKQENTKLVVLGCRKNTTYQFSVRKKKIDVLCYLNMSVFSPAITGM